MSVRRFEEQAILRWDTLAYRVQGREELKKIQGVRKFKGTEYLKIPRAVQGSRALEIFKYSVPLNFRQG